MQGLRKGLTTCQHGIPEKAALSRTSGWWIHASWAEGMMPQWLKCMSWVLQQHCLFQVTYELLFHCMSTVCSHIGHPSEAQDSWRARVRQNEQLTVAQCLVGKGYRWLEWQQHHWSQSRELPHYQKHKAMHVMSHKCAGLTSLSIEARGPRKTLVNHRVYGDIVCGLFLH